MIYLARPGILILKDSRTTVPQFGYSRSDSPLGWRVAFSTIWRADRSRSWEEHLQKTK